MLSSFLNIEKFHNLSITDRLIAQLWWHYHNDDKQSITFTELLRHDCDAGYPSINRTRERDKLKKDDRTTTNDKGHSFKLQVRAIKALDSEYLQFIENKPLPKSDTLFEENTFKGTRGYIQKVIKQINLSYDYQLYDFCTVMVRRLLETLIIEIYERLDRSNEIKNNDGHFMMFSGLLSYLQNDKKITLGRNTILGLSSFKKIADSSAHNRRFNASKKIIDDKIDDVKLAVAELKQMAFDNSI